MSNKKASWKEVLIFSGAYIAFCVGAGFGTGQESLQYFGSWGKMGLPGLFCAIIPMALMTILTMFDMRKYRIPDTEGIFTFYAGKYLGKVIYWYVMFYFFAMLTMLIAGAGAIFEQQFGVPSIVGRGILSLLIMFTAYFGLKKFNDVLGKLAYIIIAFAIFVPVWNIFNAQDGFEAGSEIAKSADMIRAGSGWLDAAIMFFSWGALLNVPYAAGLVTDGKESPLVQSKGLVLGNIVYLIMCIFPFLAMVSNMSLVGGVQAPNILLGNRIHPVIGVCFAVITMLCIFTTATPLAWTCARAFAKEGSKRYKILIIVLVVVAFLGGELGSFAQILNTATSITAYVGYVLFAAMLYTKLIRRPKAPAVPEAAE